MTRAILVAAVLASVMVAAPTAGADDYWDVFDEQVASLPAATSDPKPCERTDNPELLGCLDDAEAAFWEAMDQAERMKWIRYGRCDDLGLSTDECINWFTSAYEDEVTEADHNLQRAIDDCKWWFGD